MSGGEKYWEHFSSIYAEVSEVLPTIGVVVLLRIKTYMPIKEMDL